MKHVIIHTDGSCLGNPGKGGAAAILEYKNNKKTVTAFKEYTTNNQMEVSAVIIALKALKESCIIDLYTDSRLVVGWFQSGWKLNNPEIRKLVIVGKTLIVNGGHKIKFHYISREINNEADGLAKEAAEKQGGMI